LTFESSPEDALGTDKERSKNAETGNTFTMWFNSSSAVSKDEASRAHMDDVEKLVKQLAKKSGGKMAFPFLPSGHSVAFTV
jgi:hypothetical protein